MKSFNIHRFYATFKWMELYNYKALVRFFSILAPHPLCLGNANYRRILEKPQ